MMILVSNCSVALLKSSNKLLAVVLVSTSTADANFITRDNSIYNKINKTTFYS